jgi:glutamyl-tRNA synthetase
MSVRVRYAPSPTGLQHIGGVRSALFNYFFARTQGGSFILRIEDTDQNRYEPESLQDLYDTFEWLGITWDEGPVVGGKHGPYVQSERTQIYRDYAVQLITDGHAYECFCTSERLEELRKNQSAEKKSFGYDRHCRNLSANEVSELKSQGLPSVVRFKVPLDGTTRMSDLLLGDVDRKNEDINPDPVLLKSDGYPTYHLANVIDDHMMEITHILRAQEWIPSGPLHVLLYAAFGWSAPVFCHLPMVMGSDGHKLSKRHGSTSLRDFRMQGYLPEAIINYITLLGWSYDETREFFTKDELEHLFSLDKLNKAPAVFDYKKLDWFNGQYIRLKSETELAGLLLPILIRDGLLPESPDSHSLEILERSIPLVRERLRVLDDVTSVLRFVFSEIESYDPGELIPKRLDRAGTISILDKARMLLAGFEDRSDEENEELFRSEAEEAGIKLGDLLMPVRVAATGTRVSPPLFGSLRLLGEPTVLDRIDRAIAFLKNEVQ